MASRMVARKNVNSLKCEITEGSVGCACFGAGTESENQSVHLQTQDCAGQQYVCVCLLRPRDVSGHEAFTHGGDCEKFAVTQPRATGGPGVRGSRSGTAGCCGSLLRCVADATDGVAGEWGDDAGHMCTAGWSGADVTERHLHQVDSA